MRVFVECDPDDYYCRFIYGCTNVELSMSETMLKAQGIHHYKDLVVKPLYHVTSIHSDCTYVKNGTRMCLLCPQPLHFVWEVT